MESFEPCYICQKESPISTRADNWQCIGPFWSVAQADNFCNERIMCDTTRIVNVSRFVPRFSHRLLLYTELRKPMRVKTLNPNDPSINVPIVSSRIADSKT